MNTHLGVRTLTNGMSQGPSLSIASTVSPTVMIVPGGNECSSTGNTVLRHGYLTGFTRACKV